jgi:MFS transporter, DHA1 family, multidrug resistance protein
VAPARLPASHGPGALTVSMFLGSFAWGFAFISLPFYVQAISTSDAATTLRWTGWIVGIPSLVTVLTGPVWGRLAASGDPKRYYLLIQLLQGAGFLVTAATRTVFELFAARFAIGFMGAASTLAFMMAGREPDRAEVRRQVASVQMAMTIGQITGPLGGAIASARLGFRPSFVLAGLILVGSAAFVQWGVTVPPRPEEAVAARGRVRLVGLLVESLIVFAVSTQLFFLTSVLPQILPGLGVAPDGVLEIGGLLVFASAAAAGLGAFATPWLAAVTSERRLVTGLLVGSAAWMAALALPTGVWGYTALRFLQVLWAAPLFPLVVARVAQQGSGSAVGIVNSARIGASFVGPVVATSVLAVAPPVVLYLVLAAGSLVCVPLPLLRGRRRQSG